jgi:hypothetical protein
MKRYYEVAAVLLISAGVLFAGGSEEIESGAPPVEVVLDYFEGEVLIDGTEAELGQRLMPGSRVQTGADGFAEVVFGSGNILRIEENSDLTLNIDDEQEGINLAAGAFSAVMTGLRELGFGSDKELALRTLSTVGGVRGTSFYFRVEDEATTYVCVCNGTLALGDTGEDVDAGEHAAFRFTRTAGGTEQTPAPLLYHDNESMDSVAERVGAEIPWGRTP